ncbi:MAG: aminoglycoside phosphotransferase family protein [Chloroflexota bacterium]|nr:aminoglycoside phosphotransferase family protein [Chloroflexota bacterium]
MDTPLPPSRAPTAPDAALAVCAALGVEPRAIQRLAVGHCHYVFGVTTADGREVVARLASVESVDALAGGVYWHARLRGVGAPLARLLAADLAPPRGYPYMLLERLPGQDLALVYTSLTRAQRQALAARIVALQRRVATLPPASGYGFARSYVDPDLRASWLEVTLADVERSRERIEAAGVAPLRHAARVRARLLEMADDLRAVPPTAFLDDTTTKNVLVHEGDLSGVVDTDYVCFGDPLFTLALTRVALLAHELDPDYADQWEALLALDDSQRRRLAAYVAVFSLGFISELGQRFNRDAPPPVDPAYLRRMEALLDAALAASA